MANIHRIGDFPQQRQSNQAAPQSFPLLRSQSSQSSKPPSQETLGDMLKQYLCPYYSVKKFLVIISFVQIIVFLISLIMSKVIFGAFLQPSQKALIDLGCKYPYLQLHNLEVWRFLTPIFLHGSFLHIFFNILNQLIFGVQMEEQIGSKQMAILYIGSGIGGNLLSSLSTPDISVGCSTSVMGIFGAYLAFLIINWDFLERYHNFRCVMLILIVFVVISNLVGVGQYVDVFGHLGGFMTGIFLSLSMQKPLASHNLISQTYTNQQKIGILFTLVYFVLGFALFYTVVQV